jgi:hypothetical protein
MTAGDFLWVLIKAIPYGLAAVAVVAVGPARMMVWIGVRVEVAGGSIAQAGIDYQRRQDASRERTKARLGELLPKVAPTADEGRA